MLTFNVNEKVYIKNRDTDIKWVIGEVVKVISVNTYLVRVNDNIKLVHVDHMRKCTSQPQYIVPSRNTTSTMSPPLVAKEPESNLSNDDVDLEIHPELNPTSVQTESVHRPSVTPRKP
ncbi:hypothetical protein JTB14_029818 [Gonioctena quinquepunctata]|nr:hypothetical protein JTB14_029818 [Gonioctena quinquepunctata]